MRYVVLFVILVVATSVFAAEDVENGATDVITHFVFRDQTTGVRDAGVVIANLEMYYAEDQTAESADAFVGAHGAATDAHTAGECFNVGHGLYRVDWPDAAFDGGVGKRVHLTVVDGDGGAFTETLVVQLSPPGNATQLDGSDIQQASGYIKVSDGTGTGQIDLTSGGVLLADVDHTINHLTIDDNTGVAFEVISRGGNGDATRFTGNGAGAGFRVLGGSSGAGMYALGGSANGDGIYAAAQANNQSGMQLSGHGTGKDLDALVYAVGGVIGRLDFESDIMYALAESPGLRARAFTLKADYGNH